MRKKCILLLRQCVRVVFSSPTVRQNVKNDRRREQPSLLLVGGRTQTTTLSLAIDSFSGKAWLGGGGGEKENDTWRWRYFHLRVRNAWKWDWFVSNLERIMFAWRTTYWEGEEVSSKCGGRAFQWLEWREFLCKFGKSSLSEWQNYYEQIMRKPCVTTRLRKVY